MMYQPVWVINKFDDYQKFESLAIDFLTKQTRLAFQKYGRNGQEQYGVDAYALNGIQYVLAQFKNRTSNNPYELINKLNNDIESAVEHFGRERIQSFIIVTSHDRDNNIQDFCMDMQNIHNIQICIIFWDDIVRALQFYPDLYNNYFYNFDVRNTLSNLYNEIFFLKQIMLKLKCELMFCFLYTNGTSNVFPMCMMVNGVKHNLIYYMKTLAKNEFCINEYQLLEKIYDNIPEISNDKYWDTNVIVLLYVQKYSSTESNYNELMNLIDALLQVVRSRISIA